MNNILEAFDNDNDLRIVIDNLENGEFHIYIVDYFCTIFYKDYIFKNVDEAFLFIEKNYSINRSKFYQGKFPLEAIDDVNHKRLLVDYYGEMLGYYLYVFDLPLMQGIADYTQDDIKYIYEDAYEFFGVTKDKFHKIDFNKLSIKE